MTTPTLADRCQFCSVVSQDRGEDPIGSATPCDRWIVLEMPQPWTMAFLHEDPVVTAVLQRVSAFGEDNISLRPMLIAPDKGYSKPGYRRLLHYQRPPGPFATYQKQEFLVPEDQLLSLAIALLTPTSDLDAFESYRQLDSNHRDIFVCTHGNVDIACSRFGFPIYQTLRREFSAKPATPSLRTWRCSHFGGHRFAPTLIDLPTGQVWGHLNAEILPTLIDRQQEVTALRRFYRGWSGLGQFEQRVEREIWMQRGWDWLNYAKAGETVAIAPTDNSEREPSGAADWAEVRIHFQSPDGRDTGTYAARVEACGEILTQSKSGCDEPAMLQKQYRVQNLRRL